MSEKILLDFMSFRLVQVLGTGELVSGCVPFVESSTYRL